MEANTLGDGVPEPRVCFAVHRMVPVVAICRIRGNRRGDIRFLPARENHINLTGLCETTSTYTFIYTNIPIQKACIRSVKSYFHIHFIQQNPPKYNHTMPSLRLAELLASLSLAIDLGTGQPMEWVMRCCLMGMRFAEILGLSDDDRRAVYYLSLLRHIGCTATATLEASLFADELGLGEGLITDSKNLQQAFSFLVRSAGKDYTLFERAHFIGKALAAGPASKDMIDNMQCEVAMSLAAALDISQETQRALNQIFERWDGQGVPNHLWHDAIALPVRVVHVAQDAVTFQMMLGIETAIN